MNTKKSVMLVVCMLTTLLAFAFWSRRGVQPELIATTVEDKDEGNDDFFQKTLTEMPGFASKVDCRKTWLKRGKTTDPVNHYWQNEDDDSAAGDTTAVEFIHFDAKSRVLTVCQKDHGSAGVFENVPIQGDRNAERDIVGLSDAQLGDWNGDGKKEFFVFNGRCDQGACVGGYFVMQVDGDKLRSLYFLHAEVVQIVKEQGHVGIRMEKHCSANAVGIGPSYFAIAEFTKNGNLIQVPFQELRTSFPEATALMKASDDLGIDDEPSPQQKAYLKIHDLIVQAYQGKPLAELMKAYDAAVNEWPPAEGETSADRALDSSCSARDILKLIAGH